MKALVYCAAICSGCSLATVTIASLLLRRLALLATRTHGNLVSNATSMNQLVSHPPGDVILNWLPFSHIYARTVDHYGSMVSGVLTCLAESAETVIENLAEVQPTHISCGYS